MSEIQIFKCVKEYVFHQMCLEYPYSLVLFHKKKKKKFKCPFCLLIIYQIRKKKQRKKNLCFENILRPDFVESRIVEVFPAFTLLILLRVVAMSTNPSQLLPSGTNLSLILLINEVKISLHSPLLGFYFLNPKIGFFFLSLEIYK